MPRMPFDGTFAVSQAFGVPHPRYSALGLAGHNGVDFAVPDGTAVLAPADGEVWEVESDPEGFGYYVKLRTPNGEDWLMAHLHLWRLPHPGEWLGEGALIGYSNNTGMSTGPHLHLGYRPQWWARGWPFNGYTNPLPIIQP